MRVRIFLALETLIWLPYGIYCFLVPASLAATAGVAFQSPTGSTELRAMYGGLQVAIGVLAMVGGLRDTMTRPALLALAFLCSGLGSARLLGVLIDGGLSAYTISGLVFELLSATIAIGLLRTTRLAGERR
jgi:hypothetical protein